MQAFPSPIVNVDHNQGCHRIKGVSLKYISNTVKKRNNLMCL
jgi:hypothetical protein